MLSLSDHCYISFSIKFCNNYSTNNYNNINFDYYPLTHIDKKFNFKKTNWDHIRELLDQNFNNSFESIENEEELEQNIKHFTDIFITQLRKQYL